MIEDAERSGRSECPAAVEVLLLFADCIPRPTPTRSQSDRVTL